MISPKTPTRVREFLSVALLIMALLDVCLAPDRAFAAGCAKPPASSLVVDARLKGAKGDGRTDDTAALQTALDKVAGTGGTVLLPDGIYMVDAASQRRLKIGNDTTLKLSPNATLKAIPNGVKEYAILTIAGSSNVTVTGGTLEGDRAWHTSKEGESGMGLSIVGGAKNVTVDGITSKEMWGDGFFVENAQGVMLCSVVADHNRRQGLSVIEGDHLDVAKSTFSNTEGTRPSAGIDLEPDEARQRISNVRIHHSKFLSNKGPGVKIEGKKAVSIIERVEITDNLFVGEVPLKIEYAPQVLQSAICRNRQIVRQVAETGSLSPYERPKELLVVQHECGESGLQVRR